MTISTERLLPCPFCGGAMQHRYALWPAEGDRDAIIHAQPTDCPIEGAFSIDTFDNGVSVAEAWNRRSGVEGREAVGAVADIAAERRRQVEAEGWTPEHDDEHDNGEIACAAGIYALAAGSHDYRWVLRGTPVNDYLAAAMKLWPWDKAWWKPKDRRRDLVRAGALIAAEIDRLDRRTLKDNTHGA